MARTDLSSNSVDSNKRGVISRLGCLGLLLIILVLLSAFSIKLIGPDSDSQVSVNPSVEDEAISPEEPAPDLATSVPNIATPTRDEEPTPEPPPTAIAPTFTPVKPTSLPTEEFSDLPILATSTPDVAEIEATQVIELISNEPVPTSPAILPTPNGTFSSTLNVPILMYHYISRPPEGADKYRLDLSVTPEQFREQMIYLSENGFTTINFQDLSNAIVNQSQLPEQPIVLTFDDGYVDNYENAFPVLQELGMKATFFLATGFIDDGNPNYMDWSMIEEMSRSGMQIEPHSKTHPDLRGRERLFLIYEIRGSKETIEAHTGRTPRYFAYPSGQYDKAVIDVLKELDFWGAVTTIGGVWHGFEDRYEWSRVRVRNTTSLPDFIDIVN